MSTSVRSRAEALRSEAAYIDLSGRGLIRVIGEDRARLLHAMSTNDIQGLVPGRGVYAFFLTAQGRIIADATIFNLGDFLLMETEPELAAKLRDHLDGYIIADDVELVDETQEWATLGLEGPHALDAAARLNLPVPTAPNAIEPYGPGFVARLSITGLPGLRLFLPLSNKPEWVERFAQANVPQANADDVTVVRLENGTPRYGEDISERYLVQETEAMHAVHPSKGCYLGQEIVERVRSRAQVHRHLKPIGIAGTTVPPPGTKLVGEGKSLGEITSAAYSPALNEVVALAYLRTEAVESELPLFVAETDPPVPAHLRSSPNKRP